MTIITWGQVSDLDLEASPKALNFQKKQKTKIPNYEF